MYQVYEGKRGNCGNLLMRVWQLKNLLFLDPRWMESERDCQSNSTTDLWITSQRHLVTWPPAVHPCRHHALCWLWNLSLPPWKRTIIWWIHILLKSLLVNLPWWKIKPWGKGSLEGVPFSQVLIPHCAIYFWKRNPILTSNMDTRPTLFL